MVLTDSTLECVNRSETTATKWHIKREDNLEKLVDGSKYLFQVRCKTGCGFGAAAAESGFYPGTFFFVSNLCTTLDHPHIEFSRD